MYLVCKAKEHDTLFGRLNALLTMDDGSGYDVSVYYADYFVEYINFEKSTADMLDGYIHPCGQGVSS